MREALDEHNRTMKREQHAPLPAPAPPPAAEPTREVRVLVTGSRNLDAPAAVYGKLDEIRQRIAGAPMRVVTGDSNGAQKLAAQWARDAAVPCDVHTTDWDGARAQYHADTERKKNHDAELLAIDARFPPGDGDSDPDPDSPRQQALDDLETAVEWSEKGERAYLRAAIECRDEDMLNNTNPHLVVSFESGQNRGGNDLVSMANERDIPCERVDRNGRTMTPEDRRPDLKAIGRRPSPTLPETPPKAPTPAVDALRRSEELQRSADQTHETATR